MIGNTTNQMNSKNQGNAQNQKWNAVRSRIKRGQSFEQAINYSQSSTTNSQMFQRGLVMFEGKRTPIDKLIPLFDNATIEMMIKSGVENEKLFKKKE